MDHGTYPFVTSSTTVAGGAIIGTGLAPHRLSGVLGIVRTYTTRVGEGPFPTEMLEGEAELGQMIRERGREYGASTGRPRRCGWFDAFATRYAAEINGFTSVALTKLDVLDTLDEIKVCTGYKLDGKLCESLPAVSQDLRRIEPVYATLPGWQSSTLGMTEMNSLPAERASLCRFSFRTDRRGDRLGLHRSGTNANNHRPGFCLRLLAPRRKTQLATDERGYKILDLSAFDLWLSLLRLDNRARSVECPRSSSKRARLSRALCM